MAIEAADLIAQQNATAELQDRYRNLGAAEADLVHAIMLARGVGVTWQRIADVFGHGDRAAAKRWYDRRL